MSAVIQLLPSSDRFGVVRFGSEREFQFGVAEQVTADVDEREYIFHDGFYPTADAAYAQIRLLKRAGNPVA